MSNMDLFARTLRLVLRAAPLALALLLATPAAAQSGSYTLTFLPAYPCAINQAGDVLGTQGYKAYLITGGKTITIPPLAGQTRSGGISLNDRSQALCLSMGSTTTSYFIYDYSKGTAQATFTEIPGIEASANTPIHLNNAGEIVGNAVLSNPVDPLALTAWIYLGGIFTDLGTMGFDEVQPMFVNNLGVVVGTVITYATYTGSDGGTYQSTNGDTGQAFVATGGSASTLTGLGGTGDAAVCINDHGVIAGASMNPAGERHAVIWNGGLQDLGVLGGYMSSYGMMFASYPAAINNLGQVVGSTTVNNSSDTVAFLCSPGTAMVNLNTLINNSTVKLYGCQGINDAGQIIGNCINYGANQYLGFLLTPYGSLPPINLKAVPTGNDGTLIKLTWDHPSGPVDDFEIHRKTPMGKEVVQTLSGASLATADNPLSFQMTDTVDEAYGTYTYWALAITGGAASLPSGTSTAYQIQAGIDPARPTAIKATFTPDITAASVHEVALKLGFDHFNWVQIVTWEPPYGLLHGWNPNNGTPVMGALLQDPHLDPPIGGCYEFGWIETDPKNVGPSDALPYYYDENPNPPNLIPWYMAPAHKLNPGGDLEHGGGDQSKAPQIQLWDQPEEDKLPDPASGKATPTDYMGFFSTLVGVTTAEGALPTVYVPLASFAWSSNFTGSAGGPSIRWSWPAVAGDDTGTGGIFNLQQVDVNAMPYSVRQLLLQTGATGVSALPGNGTVPPTTGAVLSGPHGPSGHFTGPVTVTLFPTSPAGPANIASTTCSLDFAAPAAYTAPFTIAGDGLHNLYYSSTDLAGLAEAQNTQTFSIDTTPPASRVAALPASESSASFPVQWSGSDAVSGVASYALYISDNGGPFTAYLTGAKSTSCTFSNAQSGHSYGFFSIATDAAGNVEPMKTAAEATTQVGPASTPVLTLGTPALTFNAAVGAGSPAAQGITITNTGGGALDWTAARNQTWLTLDSLGGTAPVTINASVSPSGLTAGTYWDTITVTSPGAAGSPQTIAVTFNVQDVQVAIGQGGSDSATVTAGSDAVYNLAVTGAGGYSGLAAFTCSGLPAGATCGFNPAQASVNGSTVVPVTVTISTTPRSATAGMVTHDPARPWRGPWLPAWTAIALVLGGGAIATGRRRRPAFRLAGLALALSAAGMVACTSSHPPAVPAATGTPAGTYPLVVTTTSGALRHTTNLTLIVD